MKIRIGDQFETHYKAIIECTSTTKRHIIVLCIKSSLHKTGGYMASHSYDIPRTVISQYRYLGNFGKDSNFNELYNLLDDGN